MKKKILKQYGIWIDHKNAFIISFINEVMHTDRIRSGISTRIRFKGEGTDKTGMFGQTETRERQKQNKFEENLKKYLEMVIKKIEPDADAIFIMGPADSKIELQKMIAGIKSFQECYVVTEPADKMTFKQMVDKIRDHFSVSA